MSTFVLEDGVVTGIRVTGPPTRGEVVFQPTSKLARARRNLRPARRFFHFFFRSAA
jgi:hypothetical protein